MVKHTQITLRLIADWCVRHRSQLTVAVFSFVLSVLFTAQLDLRSYLLHQVENWKTKAPRTTVTEVKKTPIKRTRRPRRVRSVLPMSISSSSQSSMSLLRQSSSSMGPQSLLHPAAGEFPAFGHTVFPVTRVPDWGSMRTATEWNKTYAELPTTEYVPVPEYDLEKLAVPMTQLLKPRDNAEITRKLFYSTKYFGAYDIDAEEFTAVHPGVDLKLPLGTPIGAIAGGRVHVVGQDARLGLHVIIEHRHPIDGTFYSIYGHLGAARVAVGESVVPGQVIGEVGMTGKTTAPHVHLQVDRGQIREERHVPYYPAVLPTPESAERFVVHPIRFIQKYL